MADVAFIRDFAPATPATPEKKLSAIVYHQVKQEFLYHPSIAEFMGFVVKGHDINSPKGIEKVIHYDAPIFEDRIPKIGEHIASMRHPEHVIKSLKIEQHLEFRNTISIYDDAVARFPTPEALQEYINFEIQAGVRGFTTFYQYLFAKIFGDDTESKKNGYLKQILARYDEPSDANNNGVPMAQVIKSVEEIHQGTQFKVTSVKHKKVIDEILKKLWKNVKTYKKYTENEIGSKLINLALGLIKTIALMDGETTTQYNIDKDIAEPITINKADLIVVMNKNDLIELGEDFYTLEHPGFLEISKEKLGVGALLSYSWMKRGEVKIIHKDCLNIYFTSEQSDAQRHAEHYMTNLFTRVAFFIGTFDCYPAVLLKEATN